MIRVILGAATLSAAMSLGCGGDVGEALRPDDPTGQGALGVEGPKCGATPQYAEPLVVDWDTGARTDLEVAMKGGLVVVAYDCKTVRILNGCKLDGSYQFAGVSRKEQVVQMTSSDELAANLPLSAVKLSTEVKAGKSIDLAMVMVGKRSAPLYEATAEDLAGACDGATHFVRAANLGAFAMATGTVGKAAAAAEVWKIGASAKSESEKKAMNKDGSIDACNASTADAFDPPGECQSAIRLELMPIRATRKAKLDKEAAKDERKVTTAANPCPTGYVLSEGICTTDQSKPHLCAATDESDCAAMCSKGHAASCQNLGALLLKKDKTGAMAAYEKACAADVGDACGTLGWEMYTGEDDPADVKVKALGFLDKACKLGSPVGCENAGFVTEDGFSDYPKAAAYFNRGCKFGNGFACFSVAQYYFDGDNGMPKDNARGLALLGRACDANNADECDDLALVYYEGKHGVAKNLALAAKVQERACKLDPTMFCGDAGKYFKELGDSGKAAVQWNRGCSVAKFDWESCRRLGVAYRNGEGVPKDEAKGTGLLKKACNDGADDDESCKILGIPIKE